MAGQCKGRKRRLNYNTNFWYTAAKNKRVQSRIRQDKSRENGVQGDSQRRKLKSVEHNHEGVIR